MSVQMVQQLTISSIHIRESNPLHRHGWIVATFVDYAETVSTRVDHINFAHHFAQITLNYSVFYMICFIIVRVQLEKQAVFELYNQKRPLVIWL